MANILIDNDRSVLILGKLRLKKLEQEDIELVRKWRNSDRVRNKMVYKEFITREQQISWFKGLNPQKDFYFLFFVSDIPIGLVNLKNVSSSEAEYGVFVGEESFDGKGYAFAAVFLINHLAFMIMNLEKLVATILDDNKPAIRFNKALGYSLEKSIDGVGSYVLHKEVFNSKYKYLENLALRLV
jgi:RimJ/RimL family protein N-acetyltransferase